jgi:hypothetical protein
MNFLLLLEFISASNAFIALLHPCPVFAFEYEYGKNLKSIVWQCALVTLVHGI